MSALKEIQNFAVVKSYYGTFDGRQEIGLFVIIYSDFNDKAIPFKQNLLGLKITSKPAFMDKYFVPIQKHQFPSLEKTSWVQTNRIHTLNTSACEVLGSLPGDLRIQLLARFNEFLSEMFGQCIESLVFGS